MSTTRLPELKPCRDAQAQAQAQMVADAEQRTATMTHEQRQIVYGLGRILIAGQTLNAAQEAALQRLCALPLPEQGGPQ